MNPVFGCPVFGSSDRYSIMFIFRTDLVSTGLSKPSSIIENLKKVSKNGEDRCVGFLMAKIFKLNELVCTTR